MVLYVQKDYTNRLNLVEAAHDFIAGNEYRRQAFGSKFKETEL